MAYESGITDTIDPLGGSYYIEQITNEIEKNVWEYIDKIEKLGGALKAIEQGYFQKEIANSAYNYQKSIENNEKNIVGLNKFETDEEIKIDIMKVLPEIRKRQINKLKKLRKTRDNTQLQRALDQLKDSAETGKNIMPAILSCVERYGTLGEISDTLRKVYGEYKAI